ncbi:putative DNA-binding transcriptional regulator (modular protein) [Magnetospirillum sp. LM-5]|nr:putative DNA-binding transcriptional regulator (modular protein) [Magnetospirillum sp. LM-5]
METPEFWSCNLEVSRISGIVYSGFVVGAESVDMELEKLQDSARRASTLLKAMSNEHRLMILCQLLHGEKSVGELERLIGLSQSALSQHLARLRRDNLVQTRRQAQTIHYSLAGHEASAVINTLYGLYCAKEVGGGCAAA